MLTDNQNFYFVNTKDVQKVVKKSKRLQEVGYTSDFIQKILLGQSPTLWDDKGTPYWAVEYKFGYEKAVEGFVIEITPDM